MEALWLNTLAKAKMLREYFSFDIDVDGNVCTIPIILDQYTPDMDRLPKFLLSLGNCVTDGFFSLFIISLYCFKFVNLILWVTG